MPDGKFNCCCQPPHCGTVVARLPSKEFIGFVPWLSGDRDIDVTINDTSTPEEIEAFTALCFSVGFLGLNAPLIVNGNGDCLDYQNVRFLKGEIHYSGSVWGHQDDVDDPEEVSLHSFEYYHLQELRFDLPYPRDHIYHERFDNHHDTPYDWSIDTDTGTVTEVGTIDGYPNAGEFSVDWVGPVAVGGTSRLTTTSTLDPDTGEILSLVAVLQMEIPEDYYDTPGGSPAHSRTLTKTLTQQFDYGAFIAACRFMTDHVELANPAKVYDDTNSNAGWPSESLAPNYDRRLTWGDEFIVRWSCLDNSWPNRVVVCYNSSAWAPTISPATDPEEFYRLVAEYLPTTTTFTELRSRWGVAEGDVGCLLTRQYTYPEFATGSISDDPTSCADLEVGSEFVENECGGNIYGPGNYYFTRPPGVLAGQSWIARRYQGLGGICTAAPLSCEDILEHWDGTNPDPEDTLDTCCWPTPP